MERTIRTKAVVEPGGWIRIQSAELPEGVEADVLIVLAEPLPDRPQGKYESLIGSGKGLFANVDEVDDYIRSLREEWDR